MMIKTFADKYAKALYETGKSKKLSPDIISRATRKLEYVNLVIQVDDLKVPPGNK